MIENRRTYSTTTHEASFKVGQDTWWIAVETPPAYTLCDDDEFSARLTIQGDDGAIRQHARFLITPAGARDLISGVHCLLDAMDGGDPWSRRMPTLRAMTPSRAAGCTCKWSAETTLDVVDPRCPVAERHVP